MDWDDLVQRLWGIIETRGFEAFSDRLRSALPDRSFEPLAQAAQCLLATGHADVAQSLLGEFLSRHAGSDRIKRRLQMLLMFETRYTPEAHGTPSDIESVMAEVRDLLDSHSFGKATRRILGALEVSNDPDLLELLGRVQALQYVSEKSTRNVSLDAAASIAAALQGQDQDDLAPNEVDDLDFVWQETSLSSQQAHDSECVKAAETVQAIISATTPQDPDAIEWLVQLDDESDAPLLDRRDATSPVSASEKVSNTVGPALCADEWQTDNHAQPDSFPRVINAKRRSKLYLQEQQALAFIQTNPACSIADLASALELPIDLATHLAKTLQVDWVEKDRLGQLSTKKKIQLPSEETEPVGDDRESVGAVSLHHQADAPISTDRACGPVADIAVKFAELSERSRQLLRYVLENPGQKTQAVAEALGFSIAVVHDMLQRGLGEYLECTNFVIHPRPEVAAALNGSQLQPSCPEGVPQDSQTMTSTTASWSVRELPDDLIDISSADIERTAKLSRLSPSSKKLLRLIYDERHALSKDLSQKLGIESEQVNQALFGILRDYVTVKHSFWRVDERFVPALRLAGII